MSLSAEKREQVRQRAGRACEYCGVTETNTAGLLTVDHFHPQARGGSDDIDNLVYCCHACNGFKSDYWPQGPDDPVLWNPRREAADVHLLELVDGRLLAITDVGVFTLGRLRLNRPALIAHRWQRRENDEQQRLMTRLGNVVVLLEQLSGQHNALLEESRALLQQQRRLLHLLLNQQESSED